MSQETEELFGPRFRAAVGGVAVLDCSVPLVGKRPERLVIVVAGDADLLEVVAALAAAGRFPGLLDRRQQDGHQDGDDGDDNEQFNQSERPPHLAKDRDAQGRSRRRNQGRDGE